MLSDIKHDCTEVAKNTLNNYQKLSVDELANGYLEAEQCGNETLRSAYLSALILRFWYKINEIYMQHQNLKLEPTDAFDILAESILYAMKYKGWLDTEKKINAQTCIYKCINTILLQKHYDSRLDKHSVTYNTVGFDSPITSDDDSQTLEDVLEDTAANPALLDGRLNAEAMIRLYVKKSKIVEAMILDTIAFNDAERHTKEAISATDSCGNDYKYTKTSSEFWPYRCVQLLNSLSDDYAQRFSEKYNSLEAETAAAFSAIKSATNQKLYKYISRTLSDARKVFAS